MSAIIPERCPMISVLHTWGRILTGYTPALSIEIQKENAVEAP